VTSWVDRTDALWPYCLSLIEAILDSLLRRPTATQIARINAEHLVVTPLKPADLLFVFGTRGDVELRIDAAVRLWRQGMFHWAIVSGGMTPGDARSECEIMAELMISRGIPAAVILQEHCARNTGENVILSLPVIAAAVGLEKIRSVICLGNSWTARRYPMTLQRHWPAVEKMLVTVHAFDVPTALWHTNAEFSRRMLAEWDKIEPYKAKGFIAEWPVR
jgi:uncharacterized SAM-binding protein YcdF (DUF218 family)